MPVSAQQLALYYRALLFVFCVGALASLAHPTTTHAQAVWNATDWTLYDTITIDAANIDEDLTNFPVYVDLADLSSQFWSTTPAASSTVGTDIRVTTNDSSPVELPRELVAASSTAQTGELHFKANFISSTTDTVFRIYYNGTASDYATGATYGAENVWSDYDAVWHMDDDPSVANNVEDSTANNNLGNAEGSMTSADVVAGRVGQATSFDEINDRFAIPDDDSLSIPATNWTYSLWVNSTDNAGSAYQYFTSWGTVQTNPNFNWYIGENPGEDAIIRDKVRYSLDTGFDTFTGSYGKNLNWQLWHIVNDSGTQRFYVDGVQDSSTFSESTAIDLASTFYIGGRSDANADRYFGGEIDNVRLQDRVLSPAWIAAEHLNQSTTTDFYSVNLVSSVTGSSTLADHDATQVDNAFNFQNKTNEALFAFKLTPESGTATLTNLVFSLSGAQNIVVSDFSNLRLFRDHNNNAEYDATDEQVGGAGVMALADGAGTITFTGDFLATTSENYVLVADWNAPDRGSFLTISLFTGGVTAVDDNGAQTIFGAVDSIQHNRANQSGGAAVSAMGSPAPTGRTVETGGDEGDGGEQIGDNPNFFWPTAHAGSWSKDGGTSWTSTQTTPTLTTADAVVSLGGPVDTWGRTWSTAEFDDANFKVRLEAGVSDNTVRVDAIQVRVYHQAGGGGGPI